MPVALPRSKVEKKHTWNAESVFASPEEFEAEVKSLLEQLPAIKAFQGHLGDSPEAFIEAMNAMELLAQRAAADSERYAECGRGSYQFSKSRFF